MKTPIANQGEIRIDRLNAMPKGATKPFGEKLGTDFIISHSEQGHHHLLSGDADVIERTEGVPAGMRILIAIVREPSVLRQNATVPHAPVALDPGIYEMRIKREFDPFAKQARAVRD